jgi:Na+/H+ antiporter NhaD/arsenite permease-like protein
VLAPVLALAIFVGAFWFIATERASKVKTVLVAAGLMTILGLIPGAKVFYSEHEGIDWNVIFLLLGMMIIVGVIKQTGLSTSSRSGPPSVRGENRSGSW